MSKSALPWVVGSSPCERLPRRSFHTDVCEENIACTIFVVGALAAAIVGMMFVECFYMVGILAVCQALPLGLQQVVLWCLASNSDTSFASGASILVGLRGLEKAFLAKDSDGTELIPVVRAIAAGLFDFFFCQTNCQPKCFMGLSAAQVRAASERPKGLVFVSIDVHAGVIHSQSRRSQRVLGLWIPVHAGVFPRRSFHADDGDDIIARAIFAVGALVAMVVGTVQVFHAYTCDDPLWNLFPGAWFSEVASASCLIERNRTPPFG